MIRQSLVKIAQCEWKSLLFIHLFLHPTTHVLVVYTCCIEQHNIPTWKTTLITKANNECTPSNNQKWVFAVPVLAWAISALLVSRSSSCIGHVVILKICIMKILWTTIIITNNTSSNEISFLWYLPHFVLTRAALELN